MKQAPPLKPYLDNYMSHNTPDMQKDAAALASFSNFPLSTLVSIKVCVFPQILMTIHVGVDMNISVECHHIFKFRETEFLLPLLFSLFLHPSYQA